MFFFGLSESEWSCLSFIKILASSLNTAFLFRVYVCVCVRERERESEWSRLSFIYKILALSPEKAMAPHSSTLAWRIPGTGEPGGLPSMGSHRVGHDWSDLAAAAAASSPWTPPFYSLCVSVISVPSRHSVWDHSFPTRDKPILPAVEAWTVNHWTTREVPSILFLKFLLDTFKIF